MKFPYPTPQDSSTDAPRLVTRGESFHEELPDLVPSGDSPLQNQCEEGSSLHGSQRTVDGSSAAITDWLNFSFSWREDELLEFLSLLRSHGGDVFGAMIERNHGHLGYKRSFRFSTSDAVFAIGGQRGTALFCMPGKVCAQIQDWPLWVELLKYLKARITRWDGAVDDFFGAYSVDVAVDYWLTGEFNSGGNQPKCKQVGNWIKPDGCGRTFYIGERKNGKMMRVYEKGKQLGDKLDPWVRWELELHAKDRVIPYDVLLDPGRYVAGAYPCMNWVQEETSRIRTTKRQGKIAYESMLQYARTQYGSFINVMMQVEGNADVVVEALRRAAIPARLDLPGFDLSKGDIS